MVLEAQKESICCVKLRSKVPCYNSMEQSPPSEANRSSLTEEILHIS